jgi:uncharacterized membrane protein YeaQ/YmgE (transglycosylase-associated protein family)
MGFLAYAGVIIVALAAGLAVQYLTKMSLRREWLIVAVSAAFGAIFASESFPGSTVFSGVKDWGPEIDGLVLIPAVIGAVLVALAADLGMRASPRPADQAT